MKYVLNDFVILVIKNYYYLCFIINFHIIIAHLIFNYFYQNLLKVIIFTYIKKLITIFFFKYKY